MAQIFISYASPNQAFACRLAESIIGLGYSVWLDVWEIHVGDWTPGKVSEGIARTEYLVVVLSRHTQSSMWVEWEVQVKHCDEIAQRRTLILPILIEDCVISPLLRPKRFADFRAGYDIGLSQLAASLQKLQAQYTVPLHQSGLLVSLFPNEREDAYNQDTMVVSPPRLLEIGIELGIPYLGKVTGTWKPDLEEQNAAWELYIELVTRVSTAGLAEDAGLVRESLSSLYSIFTITRDILRKYGPSVARAKQGGDLSFGQLAIYILNYVLRPVLTKWHPLLLDYEHKKDPAVSAFEHEHVWERIGEARKTLETTRLTLIEYTNILSQVAGVQQLNGNKFFSSE